ncbi:hypothetical protein BDV11DRAFT_191121, partial [Aspergillus similis]
MPSGTLIAPQSPSTHHLSHIRPPRYCPQKWRDVPIRLLETESQIFIFQSRFLKLKAKTPQTYFPTGERQSHNLVVEVTRLGAESPEAAAHIPHIIYYTTGDSSEVDARDYRAV